jgi:hypothetical protein
MGQSRSPISIQIEFIQGGRMIRRLFAISAAVSVGLFVSACATTHNDGYVSDAGMTYAQPANRTMASATGPEIATKGMAFAESMVLALGNDSANCELEIYNPQVLDTVRTARAIDYKSQIPATIQKHFANDVSFRLLSSGEQIPQTAAETKKLLVGSRLQRVAITSMLSGTIDFMANGKFEINRSVFDSATQDFKYQKTNGDWTVSDTKKGPAIMIADSANHKRLYFLKYGTDNVIGLVALNRVKGKDVFGYQDFAYVATDMSGCGD